MESTNLYASSPRSPTPYCDGRDVMCMRTPVFLTFLSMPHYMTRDSQMEHGLGKRMTMQKLCLLTLSLFSDTNKYMTYTELSNTYSEGDMAVYPSFGICRVKGKEDRNQRIYLVLESKRDDSVVLVPEERAKELGMRHLSSTESVLSALSVLSDNSRPIIQDWKQRLNENQNLLREGSLDSYARVVNCLYRRSKARALPAMEKKIYQDALTLFLDEVSTVL
ncbi:MAG: CarD family transcriptional regulator, partial [Candidatus Ornithospirochaeta sp.]